MNLDDVKKMPPCARLIYWIKERNSIYMARRKGKLRPWTDDEILLRYKFCNVHRIRDKVSQWLLHNWFEPFKDHPNMLVACTMSRQFNSIETLEELGFPETWDPSQIIGVLNRRAIEGKTNYSGAYMIAALEKSQPKYEQSIRLVCDPIAKKGVVDSSSMENTWAGLVEFDGLGSFMAGQVVADLRWGITGDWADSMTWAPAGPGSMRGLNRVYERAVDKGMKQETFIREARTLFSQLRSGGGLPAMEMMDFQNCLCEFDKYERALWGEGHPKQLYPGMVDTSKLRRQQVEILKTLQFSTVPLSRKQIAKLSGVDESKIGDFGGPRPLNQNERTKARWPFPSLLDLGYVRVDTYDNNGRDLQLYCLSDLGKSVCTFL